MNKQLIVKAAKSLAQRNPRIRNLLEREMTKSAARFLEVFDERRLFADYKGRIENLQLQIEVLKADIKENAYQAKKLQPAAAYVIKNMGGLVRKYANSYE